MNVSQPFPIVRACIPFTDTAVHLVSPAGVALDTQVEVVSRDAAGAPRVIECVALNPAQEVGKFRLAPDASPQTHRIKPGPFAAQWMNNAPTFLLDGATIQTVYEGTPQTSDNVRVVRAFHGRHFKGWVTVFHGLDIVELVVDFHDAEVNSGHLAFDGIAVLAAGGFATALPEPNIRQVSSGLTLVPARIDFMHHVLPQRTSRPFRLVLHDGTQANMAQRYANGDGWGCANWTNSGAFQPQALPLPDLSSKRLEAQNILASTWRAWHDAMQNGTSIGIGTQPGLPPPAQGAQLDWLHPGGQQYGGATSGSERYIWGFEGVLTAATGSYDGIRALLARATLYAQRMPSLILDSQGRPALLEAFLDAQGRPLQGWRMSSANTQFDSGGGHVLDGPFGFSANSATPANACPEFTEQLKYDEIDAQHIDRWAQPLVSLAYLTNDPWAKWRLRCASECWRMMMFSAGRLDGELASVGSNRGHGTTFGRAHGESFTMACATYALSGDDFRQRWKPWLLKASDILLLAQMPNGLLRSSIATSKDGSVFAGCWDAVGGKPIYSVSKLSEESQLANLLQALYGSVETDSFRRIRVETAIVNWAAALQNFLQSSFCAWCAVAPPIKTAAPFVGVSPLMDSHKDKEELGAGIGHAMWAIKGMGAPDLSALITAYTGSAAFPAVALLKNPLNHSPGADDWSPMLSALQKP